MDTLHAVFELALQAASDEELVAEWGVCDVKKWSVDNTIRSLFDAVPVSSCRFQDFLHLVRKDVRFDISWRAVASTETCVVVAGASVSHEVSLARLTDEGLGESVSFCVSDRALLPVICLAYLPSFRHATSDVYGHYKKQEDVVSNFNAAVRVITKFFNINSFSHKA